LLAVFHFVAAKPGVDFEGVCSYFRIVDTSLLRATLDTLCKVGAVERETCVTSEAVGLLSEGSTTVKDVFHCAAGSVGALLSALELTGAYVSA